MPTYYPKSKVVSALRECKQLAYERGKEEGRAEGREEATRFVRWASELNGSTHSVLKALKGEDDGDAAGRLLGSGRGLPGGSVAGEPAADGGSGAVHSVPGDDAGGEEQEGLPEGAAAEACALALIDVLIEAKSHHPDGDGGEVASYLRHLLTDPEALAQALADDPGANDVLRKAFEESKHPRDHGKFSSSPGASGGDAKDGSPPNSAPSLNVPKDPRKLTTDQAHQALADLGYEVLRQIGGDSGHPDDHGTLLVKTPDGEQVELRPTDVKVAIYGPTALPVAAKMSAEDLNVALKQTGRGKLVSAAKIANGKVTAWKVRDPDGKDVILSDDEVRQAVVEAGLARGAKGEVITKAFDASKHPRDDAGRFVSKEAIHAAKSDPAKAEELRARVTDPEQRKKLDAALAGEADLGRTKAGEAKVAAAQRRTEKKDRVNRVRELANDMSMARRGGEPVKPEHFAELAEHLPHLTVQELRSVRMKLAASFFGRQKRDDMVTALVRHAKVRVEQLNADSQEVDLLDFGADNLTRPTDKEMNPWQEYDKPKEYSEAQHGGRMYQRQQLMANLPASDKTSHGTPDVGSVLKQRDLEPAPVAEPTKQVTQEPPAPPREWPSDTPALSAQNTKPSSKRLEVLQSSLKKKEDRLEALFNEHFSDVKAANGQPLNDKGNGGSTTARWDKQSDAIRNLKEGIEQTKRAIGAEQDKIANVASFKVDEPTISEMLGAGELKQWRKHPNTFFVNGVEGARIVYDPEKNALGYRNLDGLTGDQRKKFVDAYNRILQTVNRKNVESALAAGKPVDKKMLDKFPDLADKYVTKSFSADSAPTPLSWDALRDELLEREEVDAPPHRRTAAPPG